MAVIQDVLETVFSVQGLVEYLAAFGAIRTQVTLATQAIAAFSDESRRLFETGVILKNTASSLQLAQVQAFAEATSQATGISRPGIEGTAGFLARTGVSGEQIRTLLKTIADTARGTGQSFEDVGRAIEHGILGHMRGLTNFGIVLQDTGSKAANLALIQRQLQIRFEGAAQAFRETLPGAIDAFQSALQRFLSGFGQAFAPQMIHVLDLLTAALDFFTQHIQQFAIAWATIWGGAGAGARTLQTAGTGKNPLEQVGHGGDPATEATAQQIADNTARIADSVEQQVLGGSGEVVRQQFGYLHARLAMNI